MAGGLEVQTVRALYGFDVKSMKCVLCSSDSDKKQETYGYFPYLSVKLSELISGVMADLWS